MKEQPSDSQETNRKLQVEKDKAQEDLVDTKLHQPYQSTETQKVTSESELENLRQQLETSKTIRAARLRTQNPSRRSKHC